ncbi:MAG: zinc ribbon domain-containing protein [Ruminococcus sp.]|nr:zinc ribbon domain-containing protein [Ruminococcus sp.]
MFNKLKEKLINTNYRKASKIFVIVSLALIFVTGTVSAVSLRTQISEAISFSRSYEEEKDTHKDSKQYTFTGTEQDYKNHGEHDIKSELIKAENFTEPSLFSKISVAIFATICIVIAGMYWLMVSGWLYKTATFNSMNPVLWGGLGLAGNIGAVILFKIVSGFYPVCQNCGKRQKHGGYCRHCGNILDKSCSSCGEKVSIHDIFCHHCGEHL